jgi:hypothetical protein
MSIQLTKSEYDSRKQCIEDIKQLTKPEYQELFRIIKKHTVSFTENSNGVHFDLTLISAETYEDIQHFLTLCKEQRLNEKKRSQEMESLRQETAMAT